MSNITWMDNMTNMADAPTNINDQTNGVFIFCVIICLMVIILINLRRYGHTIPEIMIYLGIFLFILIVYAIGMKWVAFYMIMLPIILLIAGIVLKALSGD